MFIHHKYLLVGLLLFTAFFSCKKEEPATRSSAPQIVSIWPESGTPNSILTIIGYHFSPVRTDNKVQINGKDAVVIEASLTELQVAVPEDSGAGNVTLSINGQTITGPEFTYIKKQNDTHEAGRYYVKANGSGDGASWADAASLSFVLTKATKGSIIHIAAGTYTPKITITGGNSSDPGDKTFEISKNVTLIGGYPEDVSDTTTPANPSVNKTILSGGGEVYHVIAVTAPYIIGQQVRLKGLTISGGNAAKSSSNIVLNGTKFYRNNGGGVIIGKARVDIENCEIINNKSAGTSAGLFIIGGAEVKISDSKINNNITSGSNSAGIWVYQSKLFLYNCEVNTNECPGTAPAVYGYPYASVILYNTTVANNKGNSFGAGVYVRQQSSAIFVNCLIYGNESGSTHGGGGLMMYDNCDAVVISSTITDNKIAGPGGGIFRQKGTNTVAIYNSIISGNTQDGSSSDIDANESDAPVPVIKSAIINTTVYDASGNINSGLSFDPETMFNTAFLPIGANNPALTDGMPVSELINLGSTFTPALEDAYLSNDLNENSREGNNIMGALIK